MRDRIREACVVSLFVVSSLTPFVRSFVCAELKVDDDTHEKLRQQEKNDIAVLLNQVGTVSENKTILENIQSVAR